MMIVRGVVKMGFQIASGLNPNPTLRLNNTIFLQKPFFEKAVVPDIGKVFNGTININIAPREFTILRPDHEITCEWAEGVTETFWLVRAKLFFKNAAYSGYIYYPCPSSVKSHDNTIVEVLAAKIPGLQYGDAVAIQTPQGSVVVKDAMVKKR